MGISKSEAFEILELPLGAGLDDIRTSYKRLALKWHPDKHSNSPESTKKFQQISNAYKKLTDSENDNEVEMSFEDMINLFQSIFNTRFSFGGFNPFAAAFGDCHHNGYDAYDSYDSYDEDYDDDDEDDDDLMENIRIRREMKRQREMSELSNRPNLTVEEIEQNAKQLLNEDEKEKKKAEKRRLKKKRQREKKKLEKQKEDDNSTRTQPVTQPRDKKTKQVNGNHNNTNIASHQGNTHSNRVRPNKREPNRHTNNTSSSSSEEESFDPNAAFFNNVVNKKVKAGIIPEDTPLTKPAKPKDTNTTKTQQGETLDPSILRSRQLAIRGNQMANMGHYPAAIDLFTEAIKLDPKDFRFYGNRSYCFDRLQQYEKALRDADKAINLAQDWPKGYFRKGRALAGLKLFADAENAFTQVLKLDRNCEDAMQELTRVRTYQLTEMGFSRQQAESAIKHYGSVQQALDSLLAGVVAENSLAGEVYVSDEEDYGGTVNGHSHAPAAMTTAAATNHVTHHAPQPVIMTPAVSNPAKDVKMDPRNPEGLTSLWVGNVLPEVTDKKLVQIFSKHGTVTSVRCLPEKFCAFVNFTNKVGAGKAMNALQGVECGGQRLLIKFPDNPVGATGAVGGTNVISKSGANQPKSSKVITNGDRESGPVNGDECYFWRTTGCTFGKECRYKHIPSNKGVDRKPWQK